MATIKNKAYAGRKHPDQEIVTLAHGVADYVTVHQKVLTIVLAVVAVASLVFAGVSVKRSMDEQKAGPLFSAAYEVYAMPAGTTPDYARALGLFQEVHKKYPSSRSGVLAQYYVGNTLMDMGRLDDALKEYQAFTKENGRDTFLLGLVYGRMGYLYKAQGKQQEAINSFGQSEAVAGPGIASMELARLYEAAGNEPEAQKRYKLVSEKLAGTPLGMEASSKLRKAETNAPVAGGKSQKEEPRKGK